MLVLTVMTTVITLLGIFGGDVNPKVNSILTLLCFILPLLILANILLLIIWLLFLQKWMLIPIFTLGCCWNYIGCFYQIDSRPDIYDNMSGITISSYNVEGFKHDNKSTIANQVKSILIKNKVDIACFQEFSNLEIDSKKRIMDLFIEQFPFCSEGLGGQMIMSKFPIKRSDIIKFKLGGDVNSAQYADIEIKNELIRIYNIHFLTTGVSQLLSKETGNTGREQAKNIISCWKQQQQNRSAQVDEFCNYILMSDNSFPTLLCGDFNDTPYTYTYNRISYFLNDGFKSAGHGYMSTYNGMGNLLRIDYIFHSSNIIGLDYYTEGHNNSDHNPVFFRIKL